MDQVPGKHTIFTIGHSNRSIDDFIEMLKLSGIGLVADVRTIPRSRHNPQFNSDALAGALQREQLRYEHLSALGGLRHAKKDSVNTGWENASFRGFADYMQAEEFRQGLAQLIALAQATPTAIMCAEAVPWRCHRSLIGDALLVRGYTVLDIMGKGSFRKHALTRWAEVQETEIIYPKKEGREANLKVNP